MQLLDRIVLSTLFLILAVPPSAADIYDGGCHSYNAPVKLRIGTGGAGQSGLVQYLANKFIQYQTRGCNQNLFRVEWVKGDTTETIANLKSGKADLGITYNAAAELLAIKDNIADGCESCDLCERCRRGDSYGKTHCGTNGSCECCNNCHNHPCYVFQDHFYLVGPNENLGGQRDLNQQDDIRGMFSKIYAAAEEGSDVRFLSRYDKSATNIKDAELWLQIGQVPWAIPYSKWYHQYLAYPLQALEAAIHLKEFTITDRGTYLTLQSQKRALMDQITVYKSGGEDEPGLLNPGHILVGRKAQDWNLAVAFWKWATSREGQEAIVNFHKDDGICLYKGYPGQEIQPTQCTFSTDVLEEREEL